jgi:hypothetical protein
MSKVRDMPEPLAMDLDRRDPNNLNEHLQVRYYIPVLLMRQSHEILRPESSAVLARHPPAFLMRQSQEILRPMPELTLTSPYVHSRIDSNTFSLATLP